MPRQLLLSVIKLWFIASVFFAPTSDNLAGISAESLLSIRGPFNLPGGFVDRVFECSKVSLCLPAPPEELPGLWGPGHLERPERPLSRCLLTRPGLLALYAHI